MDAITADGFRVDQSVSSSLARAVEEAAAEAEAVHDFAPSEVREAIATLARLLTDPYEDEPIKSAAAVALAVLLEFFSPGFLARHFNDEAKRWGIAE